MTSAVITMLFLIRQRYDKRVAAADFPCAFPISLGGASAGSRDAGQGGLPRGRVRLPDLHVRGHRGAIWAEAAWGRYWGWDPKETWAFIAWVIYAAYLHARATAGWKGRSAAWINLLGFGAMTFNFFVVNIVISGLHSYAGLN